jgi:nucleotidyltransferase substrate binding protein (TIGR01987 family)
MTKNEAQLLQFERTVVNLREVLDKIGGAGDEHAVFRDSAIQRFEISFDMCWKTLRETLRSDYGVEAASPKKTFQEAFKQGIIDNDVVWIDMTDIRNETTHAYNEAFAEAVLTKLPAICDTLEQLLWKLKK